MTRVGVVPGRPGVVLDDLESEERPFHFMSGRLSLALATTVGERWRRNFERLVTPADLDRWIQQAGLTAGSASATDKDLREARRLRDAVHVLACAAEDGVALSPAACDVVSHWAARPDLARRLQADGTGAWDVASASVGAALATVARDAVDLFSSDAAARVRHCDAQDCSLVFLDTSRGRRRRWCSMQGCGNRAKQREFQARSRPAEAES